MTLSTSSLRRPLALLLKHALLLALIVGVVFDAWLLWQGWGQWNDQPLPSERVTAKQLHVSETQRLTVTKNITAYQQPAPIPTLPAITWQGGSGR